MILLKVIVFVLVKFSFLKSLIRYQLRLLILTRPRPYATDVIQEYHAGVIAHCGLVWIGVHCAAGGWRCGGTRWQRAVVRGPPVKFVVWKRMKKESEDGARRTKCLRSYCFLFLLLLLFTFTRSDERAVTQQSTHSPPLPHHQQYLATQLLSGITGSQPITTLRDNNKFI